MLLCDDSPLWKWKAGLKLGSFSPGTGRSLYVSPKSLTFKVPEKLQLYGLYVYYVVHICDFGMLKTLFNIVEERLKKLLNFDVSAV